MIRDFLDDLAIEGRMNHIENTSEPSGLVTVWEGSCSTARP